MIFRSHCLFGIILATLIALLFSGCQSTGGNIGDGRVDAVEAAAIRVAVGAVMTASPEVIAPAYAVSSILIRRLDGSEIATLDDMSAALKNATDELGLIGAERASFLELAGLVRAKIISDLNLPDMDAGQKLVVIRSVVEIVQAAAAMRIGL